MAKLTKSELRNKLLLLIGQYGFAQCQYGKTTAEARGFRQDTVKEKSRKASLMYFDNQAKLLKQIENLLWEELR